MCGIAGMVGLDADIKICQSLLKTMERRGPDGNGVAKFDICTLLHSRLAIIDIEGGKQPMCFEWENEVYTITYNGELYNTDEIIKGLSISAVSPEEKLNGRLLMALRDSGTT